VLDLAVAAQSLREQLATEGINLPQARVQTPTVVATPDTQIQQSRGYCSWGQPLAQLFIELPILLLTAWITAGAGVLLVIVG
jgi:hypothetical protein